MSRITGGQTIIGHRFQIADLERDLLGRGGMGDVYRSVDLQTGQAVAIKALRPEVVSGDPNALARFTREGEALRQLNHPNIVQMVGAVEQDGRHYLVMEYVPGGSLRDLLEEQGRLSIQRAVGISLEVADALTRAHHLGIVHRDLKPSNVLLAEDGTPRLTDFGHAHLAASPRLTQTGTVVGTALYLSPEACRGETLDARADIWAFGVMLYEMLSGRVPFPGETFPAVFMAILGQPVPDLAQVCPDMPDALADLIYRMLEKDRAARIPSVRLVGAELETVLAQFGGPSAIPQHAPPSSSRFVSPTPARPQAPDASASGEKRAQDKRPPHNLPGQPLPFVGRETELNELDRLLRDPEVRLVTILGAGGMGKTRLALEVAKAQLDRYEHGVYLVALAPLRSAETLVPAVANAVGLTFYPGGDPRQQLLGFLRRKRMLLVFDNFEHLLAEHSLGSVELVSDILRLAPEVVVLATSRARLNLQEEQRYPLGGMDAPEALPPAAVDSPEVAADLEGRTEYSAVRLFVQSAKRADPSFALGVENLRAVVHICRLVGGMPLGILLAAAWVEMLTAAEIADEIQQSLDFLESEARDLPERQRSMRAVYNHSWELLSAGEREVLQALSVFRGGFTREAAQQVTGASLRALRTLVNRSLLHRAPAGRYEMHELLRQYAAEKLEGQPDVGETMRDRHGAFYAAALSQWWEELKSARQRAAMAEIEADLDNVRAAWEWAREQGRAEWLAQAMDGLCLFYLWHRRSAEGAAMCSVAAHALESSQRTDKIPKGEMLAARVRARALVWQSGFVEKMGDIQVADRLVERSLALVERLDVEASESVQLTVDRQSTENGRPTEDRQEADDGRQSICCRSEKALALYVKAQCTWQTDLERARQLYECSLALYRALNDRWWAGRVLVALGVVALYRGQYGKGEQLTQESLRIYRSLGDRWGCAHALSELGYLAMYQGRIDEAECLMHQALAEAEGSHGWGDSEITLERVYLLGGKFAQALPGLETRAALYGELGLQLRLVEATDLLFTCLLHLGRYERAQTLAQANLERCLESGYRLHSALAHKDVARVALALEQPTVACRHSRESVRIYREMVSRNNLALGLAYLGYAEHNLGHGIEAEQALAEALRMAVEGRFWWSLLTILPGLALLLVDRGQVERAVELYALASRDPLVAHSRWFEDVAGKHIASASAALPPQATDAAKERGRARDLWATAEELLAENSLFRTK